MKNKYYAFCHSDFMQDVIQFATEHNVPIDMYSYVEHVKTGRPVDTCGFILLCNLMEIPPHNYFVKHKDEK